MGYKLLAPGTRRNNATWIVRGTVRGPLGKRRFEARTDTTDKADADAWAIRYIGRLQGGVASGPVLTFRDAAQAYVSLKRPRRDDDKNIRLLGLWFGDKPLREILGSDLIAAAHALKPHVSNATKNRAIISPGSAVLHYAAEQGWCHYGRHRRLKWSRRSPRRPVSAATMAKLLASTDGHKRLLLAWLYETGMRISDSLRMHRDDIDLRRKVARVGSSKTDDHGEIGLSTALARMLASAPHLPAGRVFPWRDRHGVYRWLRPLCASLGVSYTPHLSRHALATDLRAEGWDMQAIAERGLWRDPRSAERYVHHRSVAAPVRSVGKLRLVGGK